ncbi:hypothetical protein K0U83_22885 [bacterium]|nr:hypothetical protein [bacterium]
MITPIQTPRQLKAEKLRKVCERESLSVDTVIVPSKRQKRVAARYGVWLTLWTETDWKLLDMARTVKRHHATVIYGIRKASAELYGTPPKATLAMIRNAVQAARQMEIAA